MDVTPGPYNKFSCAFIMAQWEWSREQDITWFPNYSYYQEIVIAVFIIQEERYCEASKHIFFLIYSIIKINQAAYHVETVENEVIKTILVYSITWNLKIVCIFKKNIYELDQQEEQCQHWFQFRLKWSEILLKENQADKKNLKHSQWFYNLSKFKWIVIYSEVCSGICQILDPALCVRQKKGSLDILPNQHIIFAV